MAIIVTKEEAPIGVFPLIVDKIEVIPGGKKGDCARWVFKILSGKFSGRVVSAATGLAIQPSNKLYAWLKAFDIADDVLENKFDLESLVGKRVIGKTELNKNGYAQVMELSMDMSQQVAADTMKKPAANVSPATAMESTIWPE